MRTLCDTMWLTIRYLAGTPGRTATLVAALAVALGLPVFTLIAGDLAEDALMARARATPVLVGAPGDTFDLTFAGLFFRYAPSLPLPYRALAPLQSQADCVAVPLVVRHSAGGAPVVGTSPEYFEARGLSVVAGRPAALLGEVVVGANVARTHGLAPGHRLRTDAVKLYALVGASPTLLDITGVLGPSGTPDDDAVFTDVRTAWVLDGAIHGHAGEAPLDAAAEATADHAMASGALLLADRITAENRSTFHLHGGIDDQPLTAVAVFPRDARAQDLLLAELAANPSVRAVRPPLVMRDLIQIGHRVGDGLRLFLAGVALSTLSVVALVLHLSALLRQEEFALLRRMGASPRLIPSLFIVEALTLLSLSALGAAGIVCLGTALLRHALGG